MDLFYRIEWPCHSVIFRDNDGHGTFKRIKKKSFDWYKKVIATNGEDLDN